MTLAAQKTSYVTTSIPYVNANPHLGFALELCVADAYARQRRARGRRVRFVTGTDDHSLKNVLAAERAGVPTAKWVADHAAAFQALNAAHERGRRRAAARPRRAPPQRALEGGAGSRAGDSPRRRSKERGRGGSRGCRRTAADDPGERRCAHAPPWLQPVLPGSPQVQSMQPRDAHDPHQCTTRFRSVCRARKTRTPALFARDLQLAGEVDLEPILDRAASAGSRLRRDPAFRPRPEWARHSATVSTKDSMNSLAAPPSSSAVALGWG